MVCSDSATEMKECELCELPARVHCESDLASLCLDCDAKVHSANFLVARHSRSLLCQVCQSETPWRATGAKLGPTVSVCQACVSSCNERPKTREEEDAGENDEEENEEEEDGDDQSEGEDEEEEEIEEGENQVVPLSSTPSSFNSAPVASSSSEESSGRLCDLQMETATDVSSLKRHRGNADPASQKDDPGCSSSQVNCNQYHNEEDEATSYGSCRGSKDRKKASSVLESTQSIADSKAALVETLKKLQQEKRIATVLDICKLSKDSRPIDVISTGSESPPPSS